MSGFRLSTDIFSPIQSDISANDVSRFSFESLPSTPDYDNYHKELESSRNNHIIKNSGCSETMKETAAQFDVIVNDFNVASNINAKREERFKESYDDLRQSMDKLLYKRTFDSSILSPISKETDEENSTQSDSLGAKMNTAKLVKNSQNVKLSKTDKNHESKTLKISSKKTEETKMKCLGSLRQNKGSNELKSTNMTSKVSVDKKSKSNSLEKDKKPKSNSLEKDKKPKNNSLEKDKKSNCHEKPKAATSSAKTTDKTVESKELPSKSSREKSEPKARRAAKDFQFKVPQKIRISEPSKPVTKKEALSVEKAIQVAVGLQMDSIRNFILDQNLSMQKELIKLQETSKQQAEVTGYLFSVIDELIETNKKLISKH